MRRSLLASLALAALFAGCDDTEPADAAPPEADGAVSPDAGEAEARDGGSDGDAGSDASDAGAPDAGPGGAPLVVAVGYGGLRMRSTDGGLTWSAPQTDPWLEELDDPSCTGPDCETRCSGGDDRCLLRAVTWAEGRFVATGWKIFTSPDGETWTERTVERQNWCGGVAYGEGLYLCIGGCGNFYGATDGESWERLGNATEGCGHLRNLAYGNGVFVATGDGGRTIVSEDGRSWGEDLPGVDDLGRLVFRDGRFRARSRDRDATFHYTSSDGTTWSMEPGTLPLYFGHGRFFRSRNTRSDDGRVIETSEDGESWTIRARNVPHAVQSFAFGRL